MKRYLPLILLAVIIGAGIAYKMYNKPHAETTDVKADIVITPSDLLKAFETDEATANAAYLDKILEVSGAVKSVNTLEKGASLSLDTGNEMSSVICEFESSEALAEIKAGDLVKVKGFCSGYLTDIVLVRSSLIKI